MRQTGEPRPNSGTWPGVWAGMAVGVLGAGLAVSAIALGMYASSGTVAPPDEPIELVGAGPGYAVGVTSSGADKALATCTVSFPVGGTRTIEIGTRDNRFESIPEGRRLPPRAAAVVCDQRFSVSTGPAVHAYPVAGSQSLFPAYLAMTILGFGLVGRVLRARRASRRVGAAATGLAARPPSEAMAVPPGPDGRSQSAIDDLDAASRPRRIFLSVLILLVPAGTLGMLLLSVLAESGAGPELASNLLLLLVVLPAALGAGALLRRRRNPADESPPTSSR